MSNGAESKTEAVMARAKQLANQAGEKLEAAPDAARDRVREYPLATVGVAFGVGVLVGAMGWALLQPRPATLRSRIAGGLPRIPSKKKLRKMFGGLF
jgi:hypothetical protein